MKLFEVLHTKRLILRKITNGDVQYIFKIFSDNNILKYTDNNLHKDLSDSLLLIKKYNEELKTGMRFSWGICLKNSNSIIGLVSLYHIDYKHKFANILNILSAQYQRKGIISEALQVIFEFAFNKLKMNRLEAQIFTENYPPIKQLEKLGFKQEGLLRENFLISGKLRNSYMYSLLKSEFSTDLKSGK